MKVNKFSILWQIARTEARAIKDVSEKIEYVLDFLNMHANVHNYGRVMNWAKMTGIAYSKGSEQRKLLDAFVSYLEVYEDHYKDIKDDSNDLTDIKTEKLRLVLKDLESREYKFQYTLAPKAHIEFVKNLKKELVSRKQDEQ